MSKMTVKTTPFELCAGSLCLFGITAALLTIASFSIIASDNLREIPSQEDNTRIAKNLLFFLMLVGFVLAMITLAIATVLMIKFCCRIPDAIIDAAVARIENREKLREEDSDDSVVDLE